MATITEPTVLWILTALLWAVVASIHFVMLYIEIQRRRKASVRFITKWFKIFSISCILSGFAYPVFCLLRYIPGLCKFSMFIALICFLCQVLFMGWYQLSRLYYCFANAQIYSNKGYSKRLFTFMYVAGIIILSLYGTGLLFGYNERALFINTKCGYRRDGMYFAVTVKMPLSDSQSINALFIGLLVFAWDLLTLLLYIVKIQSLHGQTKNDPNIYSRIMFILYKITVLTLLYQIAGFIEVCMGFTSATLLDSNSTFYRVTLVITGQIMGLAMNYSMYLMMDHNNDKYHRFLRLIYYLRFHWICCKWRYIVIEQLNVLDINAMNGNSEENAKNKEKSQKTGTYQTADISVPSSPRVNAEHSADTIEIETYE